MQKRILVLLCAAVLAALVWVGVCGGGQDPLSTVAEPKNTELGSRIGSSPGTQRHRDTVAVEAQTRHAIGIRVHVVHADSKRAIPGVTVWYTDWQQVDLVSDEGRAVFSGLASDIERRIRFYGDSTIAGESGYAVIPVSDERKKLSVCCRVGELFGYLDISLDLSPPTPDGWVLRVGIDTTLEVQALDPTGKPLPSISIGIRPWFRDSEKPPRFVGVGKTRDPDGVFTFSHLQYDPSYNGPKGVPDAFEVIAMVPGLPGIVETTNELPVGRHRIALSLPLTGRVRVRVQDARGRLVPGHYSARIRPASAIPDQFSRERPRKTDVSRAVGGEFEFPHVGLGQDYVVSLDRPLPETRIRIRGPTSEQLEVQAVIELPETVATLRGRAVNEAGQLLSEAYLGYAIRGRNGRDSGRLRTDAKGHFLLTVGGPLLGSSLETFSLELRRGRHRGTGVRADLKNLAPLQSGLLELGDVVLASAAVLASGHVRMDGKPTDMQPDLRVESRGIDGEWRVVDAILLWDADGFELRGAHPGGMLRLCAFDRTHKRSTSPWMEFNAGASDIVVEMKTGASLEVTFVFTGLESIPEAALIRALRAQLLPASESAVGVSPSERVDGLHQDGIRGSKDGGDGCVYVWKGLHPGTYSLHVAWAGLPPFLEIDRIKVGGDVPKDGRLRGVQLAEFARVVDLVFTDAEGSVLENAEGKVWALVGEPGRFRGALQSGRARVVVPVGGADLLAFARGYLPRRMAGVSADRTVVLERSVRNVVIRLQNLPEPSPSINVLAQITASDDPVQLSSFLTTDFGKQELLGLRPDPVRALVDTEGIARLRAERPGRYRLELFVQRSGDHPHQTWRLVDPKRVIPAEVLVGSSSVEQTVQVSDEALWEAIR